jgi:hypothetical protein
MEEKACTNCASGDAGSGPADARILLAKTIVAVALGYALYVGITCPCKPELYSCHLSEMYLALAVVVVVIVYFNGTHVRSYNLHLRRSFQGA